MAKKKAARKSAGKAKEVKAKEVLVVASKVKAYVKGKNCNTSADAIQALSDNVYCMLDAAVKRAAGNKRKTVKAQDV
jgi:histone H3/H4